MLPCSLLWGRKERGQGLIQGLCGLQSSSCFLYPEDSPGVALTRHRFSGWEKDVQPAVSWNRVLRFYVLFPCFQHPCWWSYRQCLVTAAGFWLGCQRPRPFGNAVSSACLLPFFFSFSLFLYFSFFFSFSIAFFSRMWKITLECCAFY